MAVIDKRYIYLAGKIKLGHGATEYRAKIAPILKEANIFSLDPLRGKYTMRSWGSLSPNEIVVRDLQDIDRAHVVLAVLTKCDEASFGTPCECMYAWERHIPVILITDDKYLANHFWAQSLCARVFYIDTEKGEIFDDVLVKAVKHIAYWYGETVEQEVYNDPTLKTKRA